MRTSPKCKAAREHPRGLFAGTRLPKHGIVIPEMGLPSAPDGIHATLSPKGHDLQHA
jgi:hypothetical protein